MSASLPRVPLSVLETAPIGVGSTAAGVLADSRKLAQHVESLGFTRFLAAEHHNAPAIASTAPAVLAAAIGQATTRIRVGTGGILLQDHSVLVVAEQLSTLAALFPGRVDFGIGRARSAVGPAVGPPAGDFEEQVADLVGLLSGRPYHGLMAAPGYLGKPALWILGSSDYGASLAARIGFPFAFAHHFKPENTVGAVARYRREFRPSEVLDKPYAAVAVHAVCGEDDEHGAYLGGPLALGFVTVRTAGQVGPLASFDDAAAFPWGPEESKLRDYVFSSQAIGGPDTVRRQLTEIISASGADELILSMVLPVGAEARASATRVRALFGDADIPLGLAL
jgi:luciferase family oxidoreductase group 1